jgi:hypothetical protein
VIFSILSQHSRTQTKNKWSLRPKFEMLKWQESNKKLIKNYKEHIYKFSISISKWDLFLLNLVLKIYF